MTHSFVQRVPSGNTHSSTFWFFFNLIFTCNVIWPPGMLCSETATQSVNWGWELVKEWSRGGWDLVWNLGWAPSHSSSSGWLPPVFQCCEKEEGWEEGIKQKGRWTCKWMYIKRWQHKVVKKMKKHGRKHNKTRRWSKERVEKHLKNMYQHNYRNKERERE